MLTPTRRQELKGREIYVKNGCVYCHSQDTRAMDWGEGSGLAAQPGDYAYDSPHEVGSSRNGPDLFRMRADITQTTGTTPIFKIPAIPARSRSCRLSATYREKTGRI